jgi:hypothetical protein
LEVAVTARPRTRFRIDALLTVLSAVALVVSLAVPDWIEEATGLEPDAGNGVTEWAFVAVLFVCTLVFARRTRHDLVVLRDRS